MLQSSPPLSPPPAVGQARVSLFLDFDGTLVELADRPETVTVPRALGELLERLTDRLEGRLALVSGRSIAQLDGFLGGLGATVALVGSHGAEVRTPGSQLVSPDVPDALREAERAFAEAFAKQDGVLVEVKTLGVAIHYRLEPSAEAAALRLAGDFAAKNALELQRGKMMVEVRAAGHDKGSGIAALMHKPPFAGTVPIFVGDDLTDEPGFRRCAEMGGAGVLVGEPRDTAARYWLPDVAAVHQWLADQ